MLNQSHNADLHFTSKGDFHQNVVPLFYFTWTYKLWLPKESRLQEVEYWEPVGFSISPCLFFQLHQYWKQLLHVPLRYTDEYMKPFTVYSNQSMALYTSIIENWFCSIWQELTSSCLASWLVMQHLYDVCRRPAVTPKHVLATFYY